MSSSAMVSACTSSPPPPSPSPSSALSLSLEVASGRIDVVDPFESEHIGARTVYVWLPEGYSTDKQYSVLFMHDGQMLFDASNTWNNQEWGVDEVAARLMGEQLVADFIVVATDHAGNRLARWQEYFPQKVLSYLPDTPENANHPLLAATLSADNYLRFVIEELKPYIYQRYAVSQGRAHSFVAGASMGGLISLYAISEYPDEFAGAACLSTHWPMVSREDPMPEVVEAMYAYMRAKLPSPDNHRIYFDHGTETLDALYPPLQKRADEVMSAHGFDQNNWQTRVFEGAAHDEVSWNKRLHIPLLFLFGK